MVREELQARVRAALAALPGPEREVLVLRYLEQMSAREVGAVLGISEAAAKKRALRALQRLRALLKDVSGGSS
jgi:RNA polymerase sigma factor (sigma-70 family)